MTSTMANSNSALSSSSSQSSTTTKMKSPRELVQDALDANKRLQQILNQRAEQLEADLKEADSLLDAASIDDAQDEPESEIVIPGAKKATSLFPLTEFLNPVSPFYDEAIKRSNYLANTNVHPMKEKDLEVLADAVRRENQRLQAYKSRTQGSHSVADTTIDLDRNVEDLDWTKIAERVSDASSVKRTAIDCRVSWIGDKHPTINHGEWTAPEVARLSELVSEKGVVDWAEVAKQLGTNRTPLDCLRHGLPRQRHSWTTDQDQKLIDSVKSCGISNWQLVARNVSSYVTAAQCQNRWYKSLDPALQRGNWTEQEDDRLRKAVAGYGSSWVQVASAIPGRTNDQCRERWREHLNLSTEKTAWTEAEDKTLLEKVRTIGNRWKTISLMIGNNRTGPTCRLRYDKLMKLQNARNTGSSNTGPQPVSTTQVSEDGSSPTTQTQPRSLSVDIPLFTVVAKPRPIGKGKAKETVELQQNAGPVLSLPDKAITIDEVGTTGESQITGDGSTTTNTPRLMPKPRPITRAKGEAAAAGRTLPATTSLENVPVSDVPLSDNMQMAPRRRSKRKNDTQMDELPVPKKRKTEALKSSSTPALQPTNPATAPASMSVPKSADGASSVNDTDKVMGAGRDPGLTEKRTLRKRKIATSVTFVEDAGELPVKRTRGQIRK